MSDSERTVPNLPDGKGHFWDVIHGRKEMPPSSAMLGWQVLEADTERGRVRTRFEARPEFRNPMGVVHGGFVAAMLDETMGPALVCSLPDNHFSPTIELKVSYHRPAQIGPLFGEAQVLHKGGTIGFVEGKLYNEAKELVASATGTFRILSGDRLSKSS